MSLEIDRYIAAPADPYKIRKKGETSCYDRVKGSIPVPADDLPRDSPVIKSVCFEKRFRHLSDHKILGPGDPEFTFKDFIGCPG